MNPFAGKPRSYRHTSLAGARLARDKHDRPTRGPMHPAVFSRSQEGPAGLYAACGSGYRDLRQA
ncbi:hypothetical protein C4K10_4107 [Pseudomonas chlororaphis subsp. aureofaciens]|nr:hypothetical protein C4K10_4107 [Pseudomonas chlororaphis subsp. aureofaciens]AZE18364.1 hypothetical protein C4K09_3911 [Pseudomonas chlororaphis subsp. aureofaciens]